MITRRKFLATSAMGLWLPTMFGANPIITRRVVLSRIESVPDMLWQTTKVGLFNPTITKTGLPVEWDYGDGSARELTNAPSHTYSVVGIKIVKVFIRDSLKSVTQIQAPSLGVINATGLDSFSSLTFLYFQSNLITGTLPNIRLLPKLVQYAMGGCLFTQSFPSFSSCPSLLYYDCWSNPNMTGTIAIDNSVFINLRAYTCAISNYSASTIPLTTINFDVHNNAIVQSAVDQIAADFATRINERPLAGTLNTGGTRNAEASAAGIENYNLVAAHGTWVVTHN